MIPRIAILPLGAHVFAALVEHSRGASYHQVMLAPDFLAQAGLANVDEAVVAYEAVSFLLRTRNRPQLPDVLKLTTPFRTDPQLLPELRARLA